MLAWRDRDSLRGQNGRLCYNRKPIVQASVAMFVLCAWFLIDAHFNNDQEESVRAILIERPWLDEAAEAEVPKTPEQETAHSSTREEAKPTSSAWQHITMLTYSTVVATPRTPDRIVVIAKLPVDDTD